MYPKEIVVWRYGDSVPDWLSDVCDVYYENGLLQLNTLFTNTGGYNLFRSGNNQGIFIHVNSKSDFIAKDLKSNKYFTLSEKMLDLMYKKEKSTM